MLVIVFVIFIILAVVVSIIKAFSSGSKNTNAAQADKEAKEDNISWDTPNNEPINVSHWFNILLVPSDSILEGMDFIFPPIILLKYNS